MAAKKTTTKPAAKKPTKSATAATKAPVAPPREPTTAEILYPVFNQVLAAFAGGLSLERACKAVDERLSVVSVRQVIAANPDLRAMWTAVKEHRSHYLFEAVGDAAIDLRDTGFKKEAAELFLKLAIKTNPREYGDKASLALTGADGGAIKTDVTMTPSEAYARMIRGG